MKTKFFAFTFFALFATVFSSTSFAQETTSVNQEESAHRKFGLSANIQNSETGLTFPIFITQKFVLAPSVGLLYAEGVGKDISVGLVPKIYFQTERFAPYMALRVGAIFNRPEGASDNPAFKNTPDILTGLAGGAEYFLIPNFSFGVEGQFNVALPAETSMRFGRAGGVVASLGTAVTANIYFTRN